jgi:hypothetical protein
MQEWLLVLVILATLLGVVLCLVAMVMLLIWETQDMLLMVLERLVVLAAEVAWLEAELMAA